MDDEPENILEEKFEYQLPGGVAGVIRDRKTVKFPSNQRNYVSEDKISIVLNSNGLALDPVESYIQFKLQVPFAEDEYTNDTVTKAVDNQTGLGNIGHLINGTQSLVRRMRVLSYAQQTMEEIDMYNILSYTVEKAVCTDKWRAERTTEMYAPRDIGYSNGSGIPVFEYGGGANDFRTRVCVPSLDTEGKFNVVTEEGALADPVNNQTFGTGLTQLLFDAAALRNGVTVTLKLRHSGLFGGKKIIPLQNLGQLVLEIDLERPHRVFRNLQLSYLDDTSGMRPYVLPCVGGNMQYNISEVFFVASMVQLSALMQQGIDSAIKNGGLPLAFNSVYSTFHAVNDASGSYAITKAAANAISVFTVQHLQRGAVGGSAVSNKYTEAVYDAACTFESIRANITAAQYRLGTTSYPEFVMSKWTEFYEEAMKAIPVPWWADKDKASIPRHQYALNEFHTARVAYQSGTMKNYATLKPSITMGAQDLSSVADCGKPHVALLDKTCSENSFILGTTLTSTTGVAMSGQSTNAGQQLLLNITQDSTPQIPYVPTSNDIYTPGAGTASLDNWSKITGQNRNRDMYNFMVYVRLVLIQPDMNVVIKE